MQNCVVYFILIFLRKICMMLREDLVRVSDIVTEGRQKWLHERGVGASLRFDFGRPANDELSMGDETLPELFYFGGHLATSFQDATADTGRDARYEDPRILLQKVARF